jgi:ABC-type transport system involved in cytochrome c biogenesis permease component
MIFLNCILAGLGFLVGSAIVLFLAAGLFLSFLVEHEKGTVVGFDPVSMMRSSPIFWILAFLLFLLGFSRKYRRARSRRAG